MLQFYSGDMLIMGVTRENLNRLIAQQPIQIDVQRHISRIAIVFGETKPDIVAELVKAGLEVADVHKAAAEADPL